MVTVILDQIGPGKNEFSRSLLSLLNNIKRSEGSDSLSMVFGYGSFLTIKQLKTTSVT